MGIRKVEGHIRGQVEDNIRQMGVPGGVVEDGRGQRGRSWDHRVRERAVHIVHQGDIQGIRVEWWEGSCMEQGERGVPGCEGTVHPVAWGVERERLLVWAEERGQVMACLVEPRSWQVVGQVLLS